jgi:cytochrome c oxidase subunit 2
MAAAGEQLANRLACLTCHRAEGGGTAPSFVKLYGSTVRLANGETALANEGYLRESILQPQRQIVKGYPTTMPTFQGQVNEEQMMQLDRIH